MCTHFNVASVTLYPIMKLLEVYNKLYQARLLFDTELSKPKDQGPQLSVEVFESDHPYLSSQNKKEKIEIKGARRLSVTFDTKCEVKSGCAYLELFKDEGQSESICGRLTTDQYSQAKTFPTDPLIIEGDCFWYYFYSDGCGNPSGWGYKFTVSAELQKGADFAADFTLELQRTICWLAGRCAAQFINAEALAFFPGDDTKYQNILNSKLLSGGMEERHFSMKDEMWKLIQQPITMFGAGHLENYLTATAAPSEMKEDELLLKVLEGNDPKIQSLIQKLQEKLMKTQVWARVGGELADKLVCSAFAVFVKHSKLVQELQNALSSDQFDEQLFKKWTAASRMRTWLVEKRKNIDDAYERQKLLESKDITSIQKAGEIQVSQTMTKNPLASTEETLQKLTEAVIRKAQFLLQLKPSLAWNEEEAPTKPQLFRQISEALPEGEDYWKKRLQQWKQIRQKPSTFQSLEEQKHEIHLSLTTSILLCLQSPLPLRRLRKQVEGSYLKAICRTCGINALNAIMRFTPQSVVRDDVLGFLMSSLRSDENKLVHYLDGLQGCGFYLEQAVKQAFQDLLFNLVKFLEQSNEINEIHTLLDSFLWKYRASDHKFLQELDFFRILRGFQEDSLLRKVWGKSLIVRKSDIDDKQLNEVKPELVKAVLELFEVTLCLCVTRSHDELQKPEAALPKMTLSLERNTSALDEASSEMLFKQAFRVIFGELEACYQSYFTSEPLDWSLWLKKMKRKEELEEKKKEKDKQSKKKAASINGEEGEQEAKPEAKELKEKDEDNQDKKMVAELKKQEALEIQLYDPGFSYRLIQLLYKCVCLGSQVLLEPLGNPKYISTLYSLLKVAPPEHKILITKILQHMLTFLPEDIFIAALERQELGKSCEEVVQFFFNIAYNIRKGIWEKSLQSEGDYAFSCSLINLLQSFLTLENWKDVVVDLINKHLRQEEKQKAIMAMSIVGGEIKGLRRGCEILIQGIQAGILVGFAENWEQKEDEEEAAGRRAQRRPAGKKKAESDRKIFLDLDPNNTNMKPLIVESLEHADISTEEPQNIVCLTDTKLTDYYSFIKNKDLIYEYITKSLQTDLSEDTNVESLNLRVSSMRTLLTHLHNKETNQYLAENQQFLVQLLTIAIQPTPMKNVKSLELVEELLYRQRQYACESSKALSISRNVTVKVVFSGNVAEIEVQNYQGEIALLSIFSGLNLNALASLNGCDLSQEQIIGPGEIEEKLNQFDLIFTCNVNIDQYKEIEKKTIVVLHQSDLAFLKTFILGTIQLNIQQELISAGFEQQKIEKIDFTLQDIDTILSSLVDQEQAAPQEEEPDEEEPSNPCFRCKEEEKEIQNYHQAIKTQYSSFLNVKQADDIVNEHQIICKAYVILAARRALLLLLENSKGKILNNFQGQEQVLLNWMKLLYLEVCLQLNKGQGEELTKSLKKIITDILKGQLGDQAVIEKLKDILLNDGILSTLLQTNTSRFRRKDLKASSEKQILNNEPFVQFAIWLSKLFIEIQQEPIIRINIIDSLLNLACLKAGKEQRSVIWELLDFILCLFNKIEALLQNCIKQQEKFPQSMLEIIETSIFKLESAQKLKEYWDVLKGKEKQDHSKSCQLITEIQINLMRIERLKVDYKEMIQKLETPPQEEHRDRFLTEFLDTIDMMRDLHSDLKLLWAVFDTKNPKIMKEEVQHYESAHYYFKNPTTFKIFHTLASELTIRFDESSIFEQGDALNITADIQNKMIIQSIAGKVSKRTVNVANSFAYITFPTIASEMFSFGNGESGKLGHGDTTAVSRPKSVSALSGMQIKQIEANDSCTAVLTKDGEIWAAGSGVLSTGSNTLYFNKCSNIKDNKIEFFSLGNSHVLVYTQEHELFGLGSNQDGRLGLGSGSGGSSLQPIDMFKNKKVKAVSCGFNHSLVLLWDNKLYSTGHNDKGQLGYGQDMVGRKQQQFRQTKFNFRIVQIQAAHQVSVVLGEETIQGKLIKTLWTCGDKEGGKLGLGEDIEDFATLSRIKTLEHEDIAEFSFRKKHGIAITTTGKIFAWGANDKGQLGTGDNQNLTSPKEIEFFKSIPVKTASTGVNHTVVLTQENKIYAFGEVQGGKLGFAEVATDSIAVPKLIDQFTGKPIQTVYCGPNHTIIATYKDDLIKQRDNHELNCMQCQKNQIVGWLYITIEESKFKAFCHDCYISENKSQQLTQPWFLLRTPSEKDLTAFQWPLINQVQEAQDLGSCVNCSNKLQDIAYKSIHDGFSLCKECLYTYPLSLSTPTVLAILTPNLKLQCEPIDRSQFYTPAARFGYKFSIQPKLSTKGCKVMMKKYESVYQEYADEMSKAKYEIDEQIVDLINNFCQKEEKDPYDINEKDLKITQEDLSIRPAIETCNLEFIRTRFQLLKLFNEKVKQILGFIDFSYSLSIYRLKTVYQNAAGLVFWSTKQKLIQTILKAEEQNTGRGSAIRVDRMRASRFVQKGIPDHKGEYTVFGQIWRQIRHNINCCRIAKGSQIYSVNFVGEASIDVGGPYRESISQMCSELQSVSLPLFIKSPNQQNDSGQNREKWMLNPSSKSPTHLAMYEFVGRLMGVTIRTGEFLNLDLPSMVWKSLLGMELDLKDLEGVDRYTIQCLEDVMHIEKKGVTEENFGELIHEKFVCFLSDGSEVELKSDGKQLDVTFNNRHEYIELVKKTRLTECIKQAQAIQKGLKQVVPASVLSLLTWRELETLVCGRPILDVELLRANSIYRGCSESDAHVQFFWKALTEYSPEERSMYLRFVWGRSRLPLTSKDFPEKHKIELLRRAGDPDACLPTAHTCFFSIELPKYSTYEILREKLRYAITHCQAIDTDGRAFEVWEDEES